MSVSLCKTLILVASLFIAFFGGAKSIDNELTIYTEEFPPYNFMLEGRLTGINIELLRLTCERAKVACKFEMYPWNRAMRYVRSREDSGLVSTARTPAREGLFQWVGPLASGLNCLYKLTDRTDINIKNLKDATNYSLGVSRDAIFIDLLAGQGFEKGKNLVSFSSKYGVMKPFAARRVDLMLGSANSIKLQSKHAGLKLEDISPVLVIDLSRALGNFLAINQNTRTKLVNKLQEALDEITLEGELERLISAFSAKNKKSSKLNIDPYLKENCL